MKVAERLSFNEERRRAREVACPQCGAERKQRCKRRRDDKPIQDPHAIRVRLLYEAIAEGEL